MYWRIMLLLTLLLRYQFYSVNCHVNKDLIDVVANFFGSQKAVIKVTTFLCWNAKDLVYAMKCMNKKNVPISINRVSTYKKINIPYFQRPEHQFYLLDLDCEYSQNILQNANKNNLLKSPFRWLVIHKCSNEHDFSKYNILLNSRIYTIDKCKAENNKYHINSIYKHVKSKSIIRNNVALWNKRFEYMNRISDIGDRSNQMGLDVNISMVVLFNESRNDLVHMRERNKDAISKHNYMLMLCIIDIMNITPRYIFRPSWGYPDPKTGKYNGLVGDLLAETSQLASSPLFIVKDKIPFIDYVADTAPTQGSFIFRAPPLSSVSNIFRLPFNSTVWLASFIILILIFFVMYSIMKWEWSLLIYQEIHGPDKIGVLKPMLLDIMQLEIGAVCQQGAEAEPKSHAGRVGFFFISLSLMFIYTAYSANIVALLQSTTDSIKTLEDLYNSKIELGVHDTPYNSYHFKTQKHLTQRLIVNRALPDGLTSLEEGVERMRTEFYAFFAENDAIYKTVSDTYIEHEKCGLIEMKFWSINHPWMPLKKNSTFKEIVKVAYAKMDERGIRDRNFKRLYTTKPKCQNQGVNFISVSINDCYFALVTFIVGLALSLLILLVETIIHRFKIMSQVKSTWQ